MNLMRISLLAFCCFGATLLGSPPPQKQPEEPRDKLLSIGTWKLLYIIAEGKKETNKNAGIQISDNAYYAYDLFSGPPDSHLFKVDPSKNPKHVDFDLKAPFGKVVKVRAVYEIKSNELKVYVDPQATERPKRIEHNPKTPGAMLLVFRYDGLRQ